MKEYCRICLAVDVGMDKFRDTEKRNFIERIFKHHGHYRLLNENHSVCYICEALLTRSYAFIERALRAQEVLNEIIKKNNLFTAGNMLVDIDRQKYKLNYSELSYKKINIGSIDESEFWSVKEEMDSDDNDIINDNLNCERNDRFNVDINDTERVQLANMLTDSRTNEKNTDLNELEIKLEEPCIDIALINNNKPLVVMTEGKNNNPVDIMTEENNPLDMTEENNPLDMTEENNLIDMTEENNPLDMTEENNLIDMTEENNPLDMTEENNPLDMTEENNLIDMTEENNPIDIMTEENNPLDMTEENNPLDMTEENNPLDMTEENNLIDMTEENNLIDMTEENNLIDMTEENNLIDMTEENNPIDIMTEENNPIDIMTEENNPLKNMYKNNDECYNEIDNLFDFQCNDIDHVDLERDNVSNTDETDITKSQADNATKETSLHNNNINKKTDVVTREVHEIIIDSDSMDAGDVDNIKKKKVTKKEDISKKQDSETMDRKVCENIKPKNMKARLMKRKDSMGSGNNKPKTKHIARPYNEKDDPKRIIIEGKREEKTAKIIYKDSDISDEEESEIKKGRLKRRISSDYVPDSSESFDSEWEREYPMTCEQCDSVLSSKTEHCHHYMEMHPNIKYPYGHTKLFSICEICGARFHRQTNLTTHLLTHGAKTRQCGQCPKMFHTSNQLQQHIARVHAPRKFECNYCQKRFPDKGSVRLHIRTHTKEKPYKCHICNAGFAHGGNRLLHIRVKHQNLPYPLQEKQNKEKLNKKKKRETKNKTKMSGNSDDTVVKRKTIKRKIKKRRSRRLCPNSDSD